MIERIRKTKEGIVISNKMDKTAVVVVTIRVRHPRYQKAFDRRKKYYAHDPENKTEVGQKVEIMETRPFSKLKRWRVCKVL